MPHDDRFGPLNALAAQFPSVRFLRVGPSHTYAQLRSRGVRASLAPIVALTEDHCIPQPDWCAQILQSHAGDVAAVGGAVEKEPDGVLNWALYLADYSRYMNPLPEGAAHALSDCNVSYKRAALDGIEQVWDREFHENLVHQALAERGERLWFSPAVVVRQQRSVRFAGALSDRFAFGRLLGSGRVPALRWPRRAMYAASSCILPLVLLARVAKNVRRNRACFVPFLRALPALVALSTMWSMGEMVGYVTGKSAKGLRPSPCDDEIQMPQRQGVAS